MDDPVINQAKIWGFICRLTAKEQWEILSSDPKQGWCLSPVENRWCLKISNVSQIYLSQEETLAFLERRRSFLQDNKPTPQ
jgi:hypothetical protein